MEYKLKRYSNKECCKQCIYVKFKGTMTKWPVQKLTHITTQKHVQHVKLVFELVEPICLRHNCVNILPQHIKR